MATEFSMLQIMNAALISEGLDEIVTENDGSDEWRLLSRNWSFIVEAELEDGAYFFTKTTVFLQSRQDGKYGYDDSYIVPAGALHVRSLWTEDAQGVRSKPDWVQDGTSAHVNEPDGVWIEYVSAAGEHLWSANFARGVQLKLQALILNFREERSAAAAKEQQAEMAFQRARTSSSKSRSPTAPYKPSRYAIARFTRG